MGSGQSINDKLKHLKVDEEKSGINKEMENRRDWALEHLLLTKGHQEHISPPLTRAVSNRIGFAEANGLTEEPYPPLNKETGSTKDNEKDQL